MKILVTGATGFIGNHVIRALLDLGLSVIATSRSRDKAEEMPWFTQVDYRELDIADLPAEPFTALGSPDRMIHLAWSGLPNFKSAHHMDENLPKDKAFLSAMLKCGLKHVLVAGTCFEYGMREGELSEDMETSPDNPYGLAKDTLRRELQAITVGTDVIFQWARLFYMYGPGQSQSSLFPLLQKAIDNNDTVFDMSGGEQIRDFLPVKTIAEYLVRIALQDEVTGIINVCSGRSATVRQLVEEYLEQHGARIELNLGHYPYPDYEPFRFWGNADKLNKALASPPIAGHISFRPV